MTTWQGLQLPTPQWVPHSPGPATVVRVGFLLAPNWPIGPTTVTRSGVGFVPGPHGLWTFVEERIHMLKYLYPIYRD
jgi:hypothetical protein